VGKTGVYVQIKIVAENRRQNMMLSLSLLFTPFGVGRCFAMTRRWWWANVVPPAIRT